MTKPAYNGGPRPFHPYRHDCSKHAGTLLVQTNVPHRYACPTCEPAYDEPLPFLPDLLPCPFCGYHATLPESVHGKSWGSYDWQITCSSSHCRARVVLVDDTFPDRYVKIHNMWNRRARTEELRLLREVMETARAVSEHSTIPCGPSSALEAALSAFDVFTLKVANCPHPADQQQREVEGVTLARYPLRHGSAAVEICGRCSGWRMFEFDPYEWHEGPYADDLAKAGLEAEER